jgi:hypothetical protein
LKSVALNNWKQIKLEFQFLYMIYMLASKFTFNDHLLSNQSR